ncbi:hypothetical protein D9757_001801 [Collybiopsis confluens]|uniref:Uncharacterized protein n=1 Tax=Collybiopsis confluens TaxID=2823264 RepID=A0A8H5HYI4_9AGAR|nr:hypothetical protein D9757_001801 [Collybiopsis confluens]
MSPTLAAKARDGEETSPFFSLTPNINLILGSRRVPTPSFKAALARTATRGLALYFSRPVRLFRPSKVSGWLSLRGLASFEGAALSPLFVRNLVKSQGLMVIPRHFVPPMVVNALLGTVLWTTYAETSRLIEPNIGQHPTLIAACAGGVAGGIQAIVAAPIENVRLLLEGGSGYHSWSHAWKDVFKGTVSSEATVNSRQKNVEDVRQIGRWMRDVGDMAGRGWDGWGWGCAKDVTDGSGFALFFSLFEVTRRVALQTREHSANFFQRTYSSDEPLVRHGPKTMHGLTLVCGGVIAGLAYELTGRPWDYARKLIRIHKVQNPTDAHSVWLIIARKMRQDGLFVFFKNQASDGNSSRLAVTLRTLGRGCVETDRHTHEKPDTEPVAVEKQKRPMHVPSIKPTTTTAPTPVPTSVPTPSLPPPSPVIEEDDLNISVTPGTACRRPGCGVAFASDEENRLGDGQGTRCTYHPSPPIFREGSKGYLCCKRRVLEFDEFLKIEGCKTGRHLFSPKVNPEKTEDFTSCRIDHYQTVDQVHVSVFAKKVDKERSNVRFQEQTLSIDLYLPDSKRFLKDIELFGPITPEQSTFQFFGTKVEVHLKKQDARSWTILEKPTSDLGNIALTFGVSGRTGTVGAKRSVLDAENSTRV